MAKDIIFLKNIYSWAQGKNTSRGEFSVTFLFLLVPARWHRPTVVDSTEFFKNLFPLKKIQTLLYWMQLLFQIWNICMKSHNYPFASCYFDFFCNFQLKYTNIGIVEISISKLKTLCYEFSTRLFLFIENTQFPTFKC